MTKWRLVLVCFVSIVPAMCIIFSGSTYADDLPVVSGPYLGQNPPGMKPELLAPGVLPTDGVQHCFPAFSPDGKQVYWMNADMSGDRPRGVIMFMEEKNGRWTEPDVAPFSGEFSDHAPVFSGDGKRLYFASSRPGGNGKGKNLWFVEKTDSGWSQPVNMGFPPNPRESGASQPTFTKDGTVYFMSVFEGAQWNTGIYRSRFVNGQYSEPEPLPEPINLKGSVAIYPYIAPDESFLIFGSTRPGARSTETDLFISFRKPDDAWTEPRHMGDAINNGKTVSFSFVTHDGKYLIFNRFGEKDEGDLFFWVDARIIDQFRPQEP